MPLNVDPSRSSPPDVEGRERPPRPSAARPKFLPGWLWLLPGIAVLSYPALIWTEESAGGNAVLRNLALAGLFASASLIFLFAAINSFIRGRFDLSNDLPNSGWSFALIGAAFCFASVAFCYYAANFASQGAFALPSSFP